MEKYFVFAFRVKSGQDCVTISENEFPSLGLAFNKFYTLVGQLSSFSSCFIDVFDCEDSTYIKKIRIKSCDVFVYVYLQKLS